MGLCTSQTKPHLNELNNEQLEGKLVKPVPFTEHY